MADSEDRTACALHVAVTNPTAEEVNADQEQDQLSLLELGDCRDICVFARDEASAVPHIQARPKGPDEVLLEIPEEFLIGVR